MRWNYRVIRRVENGEAYYSIHECYYATKGTIIPESWTTKPTIVSSETRTGLLWVLAVMTEAVGHPILEERDGKLVIVEPEKELSDDLKKAISSNKEYAGGDVMTDAIEAGARAKAIVTDEIVEDGCIGMYGQNWNGPPDKRPGDAMKDVWRKYARNCIEAAIASGALVPASAVAEMRERCATAVRDERLVDPVDSHDQTYNDALDHAESAIRAIEPASGEYVLGWRTMDSVPINKAVLIKTNAPDYYGNGGVYAALLVDMGSGRRWHTFGYAVGRDLGPQDWPIGWMPMPAPPIRQLSAGPEKEKKE